MKETNSAKVKKPIYKRVWFIALVTVVVLFAATSGKDKAPEVKEAPITSIQLLTDMKTDVSAAKEKYEGKEFSITGVADSINVEGNMMRIITDNQESVGYEYIVCDVKYSKEKEEFKNLVNGSTITVSGEMELVDEGLGYVFNIYTFD